MFLDAISEPISQMVAFYSKAAAIVVVCIFPRRAMLSIVMRLLTDICTFALVFVIVWVFLDSPSGGLESGGYSFR